MEVMLVASSLTASKTKRVNLRNHAPRSYMTWLPVTLSVLNMIIENMQLDHVTDTDFENSPYAFGQ